MVFFIFDGSYPPPASMITFSFGESIGNLNFYDLMRHDESILSWVLAAFSLEVLVDVCDCLTSFHL